MNSEARRCSSIYVVRGLVTILGIAMRGNPAIEVPGSWLSLVVTDTAISKLLQSTGFEFFLWDRTRDRFIRDGTVLNILAWSQHLRSLAY